MNKSQLIFALGLLALGYLGGQWMHSSTADQQTNTTAPATKAPAEKLPLFYRHPMNPQITSPQPAKDSMGMDYIAVYAAVDDDLTSPSGTVRIDPVVVQNIGVRTTKAKLGSLSRTIRAVGRIGFDEGGMFRLHPKTEGWVTEIRVDKRGQQVAADEILLSLYSPKLVASQQEYLLSLSHQKILASSPFEEIRRGAEALVNSSRQRLLLMDAPEHQIQVRTTKAKLGSLSRTIRAVGRIGFDEGGMFRLHPKTEGWVTEIRVDKRGQQVAADEILLSLYSPKLVASQQEYLLSLSHQKILASSPFEEIRRGAEALVNSSRQRLLLMDAPEHQIQELERSKQVQKNLHIHSPVAGSAIAIGARDGQFVTPSTELYMIVDLTKVWVYVDIYDIDLPWTKLGDPVQMTLASVPGQSFSGELAYIYPYAESVTRTTKVRLLFDNPDGLLRPDMLANVMIESAAQANSVMVPAEAIIRSGSQNQLFVQRAAGKFEPRLVTLGHESDGIVAVLSGVEPGEQVVTSAQFLIDSESRLREAAAKMVERMAVDIDEPMDMRPVNSHQGMSGGAHQHD